MKNKTLAVWITFIGGPLGLHRLYLKGRMDALGWLLPIPTLLGLYGVQRARDVGLEDTLSWALIPLLGLTIAGCALTAIVYGLMDTEKWNQRFNPSAGSEAEAGKTGWWTILGLATALLLGATVLMSTIAFSFQRYFEYQMEAQLVQPSLEITKKAAD
jgi:hypothetical protein